MDQVLNKYLFFSRKHGSRFLFFQKLDHLYSEEEIDDDEYESLDDLEDVDMSLERIDNDDEFEEYEDDNLKVEGQVSNRRVDLGDADMDRVRKPWPTKSRQQPQQHQQQQQQGPNSIAKLLASVLA